MPSSPITTEHFPGPSTYPALSSKRRRHRYSSSSSTTTTTSVPLQPEVPRGCDSDDRRKSQGAVRTTSRSRSKKRADKDTDEEERAEKGMTIEYYDINGRLLRLWSNQGDLFTPPRDACLDEDGGYVTSSASRAGSVVPVSATVSLPRVGRDRDRDQGADHGEVGEFGALRVRSRSVPRDGAGAGRGGGGGERPEWLEVPQRPWAGAGPSTQSLPSSARRGERPVSSPPLPPPLPPPQAASAVGVSSRSLPNRDAVEPTRRMCRVVVNPPVPPPTAPLPAPPSSSSSRLPSSSLSAVPSRPPPSVPLPIPPSSRSPPVRAPSRPASSSVSAVPSRPSCVPAPSLPPLPLPSSRPPAPPPKPTPLPPPPSPPPPLSAPSSNLSSSATTTTQTRSLRRKPGFVLDRPKTLLETQSQVHRRNWSSPPSLIPTIPSEVGSCVGVGSLEIEAPVTSTVVGREEEERRRRKRYLSEGSVPSAFREERVDVDWEGARWYSCVDVGVGVSVNGKGRDPVEEEVRIRVPDIDDQDDENKKEENDEEDTEEEEEEVLNPLPLSSSFFPPEWSTPPSFVENRRKSHSGVLSYTPNFSYPTPPTSTFTPPLTFTPPPTFTSTSTLNSTPGTSCLDTLPPLISAFGLGKGHPSFPPPLPLPLPLVLPRERKPTMGRWGRRAVVVSDPGVQGVTVVGVGGVGVGVGGFGTGVGMGVGGEGV